MCVCVCVFCCAIIHVFETAHVTTHVQSAVYVIRLYQMYVMPFVMPRDRRIALYEAFL
jgi:cadmium resistance protein CadD (predicted permease)